MKNASGYIQFYVGLCRENTVRLMSLKEEGIFNDYLIPYKGDIPAVITPYAKPSEVIQGGLTTYVVNKKRFLSNDYDCDEYQINTGKLTYNLENTIVPNENESLTDLDELELSDAYMAFYKECSRMNNLLKKAVKDGIYNYYLVPLENEDVSGIVIPYVKQNTQNSTVDGTLVTMQVDEKVLVINHYDCTYDLKNGRLESNGYQKTDKTSAPFKPGDEFIDENQNEYIVYSCTKNSVKAYDYDLKLAEFTTDDPDIKKIDWLND